MFKTKKEQSVSPLDQERYSSGEVSEIAGVSLRQLQWWDEQGVVSPRQEGHRRVYAAQEVVEVSVIAELRRKGFSLQKIRRVLKFLNREMGKRLGEAATSPNDIHLVTDGKSIYLEQDPNTIIDILKNASQPMFLVCVSDQLKRFYPLMPEAQQLRKPATSEPGAVKTKRKLG